MAAGRARGERGGASVPPSPGTSTTASSTSSTTGAAGTGIHEPPRAVPGGSGEGSVERGRWGGGSPPPPPLGSPGFSGGPCSSSALWGSSQAGHAAAGHSQPPRSRSCTFGSFSDIICAKTPVLGVKLNCGFPLLQRARAGVGRAWQGQGKTCCPVAVV